MHSTSSRRTLHLDSCMQEEAGQQRGLRCGADSTHGQRRCG
jgi:hypothetical protein